MSNGKLTSRVSTSFSPSSLSNFSPSYRSLSVYNVAIAGKAVDIFLNTEKSQVD